MENKFLLGWQLVFYPGYPVNLDESCDAQRSRNSYYSDIHSCAIIWPFILFFFLSLLETRAIYIGSERSRVKGWLGSRACNAARRLKIHLKKSDARFVTR